MPSRTESAGKRETPVRSSWPLVVAVTGLLALAAVGLTWASRIEITGPDRRDPHVRVRDDPTPRPVHTCRGEECGLPLGSLANVAVFALAVLVVALMIYGLWRFRWQRVRVARGDELDLAGLRRMLAAGRNALVSGSDGVRADGRTPAEVEAREAVIACYRAMERALEQAGVDRGESGTPTGLLHDAVERRLFAESAAAYAGELTELFERARFTARAIRPDDRDRALRLLSELETSVDRGVGERDGAGRRTG